MAISFGKVALRVHALVKSGNRKVKMFDEIGTKVYDPEKSRRFFAEPEHMMITIHDAGEDSEIKVFLSEGTDIEKIQRFLNSLRKTSVHYNLKFTVRKYGHKLSPKDFAYQAEIEKERMQEGIEEMETVMEKMTGTTKTSRQKIGDCTVVVRHNSKVDEKKKGARGRDVKSVFVETRRGERFRMPQPHVNGGRAMARHISMGGSMGDETGSSICGLMNEWADIRGVSGYISENIRTIGDNASSRGYRSMVRDRVIEINQTLKRMSGSRAYTEVVEQLAEASNIDESRFVSECDSIRSTLCLEEGDDSLSEGIAALARFAVGQALANSEPVVEEPVEPTIEETVEEMTVAQAIEQAQPEEFREFFDWTGQFDPSNVLVENEEYEMENDTTDELQEGEMVSLVPTPAINQTAYPEANWITSPIEARLMASATPGTLDIIECETKEGEQRKVYGFNISGKYKENPDEITVTTESKDDSVWDAAARLVKWRSDRATLQEMTNDIDDEMLERIFEKIAEMWMPTVAADIRETVMQGREARISIQDEWDDLVEDEQIEPEITTINFTDATDMIVGTRHLGEAKISFETNYENLELSFANGDDRNEAYSILEQYSLVEAIGGDKGDDFINDINLKSRRQDDGRTPTVDTDIVFEVPNQDVNELITKLDARGITYSVSDNIFYFENEDDRSVAITLYDPSDVNNGIVGEMETLKSKVVDLSAYR